MQHALAAAPLLLLLLPAGARAVPRYPPLREMELLEAVEFDLAIWKNCLEGALAVPSCFGNAQADARVHVPLEGSPFSRAQALDVLDNLLAPVPRRALPTPFARVELFPRGLLLGNNSVGFALTAVYACAGGGLFSDEHFVFLRLSPESGLVTDYHDFFDAEGARRMLARCRRAPQPPRARPQAAFGAEARAVERLLALWNAQGGRALADATSEAPGNASSAVLADDVRACYSWWRGDACTAGRAQMAAALAPFRSKASVALLRGAAYNEDAARATLTLHAACHDDSFAVLDLELLLSFRDASGPSPEPTARGGDAPRPTEKQSADHHHGGGEHHGSDSPSSSTSAPAGPDKVVTAVEVITEQRMWYTFARCVVEPHPRRAPASSSSGAAGGERPHLPAPAVPVPLPLPLPGAHGHDGGGSDASGEGGEGNAMANASGGTSTLPALSLREAGEVQHAAQSEGATFGPLDGTGVFPPAAADEAERERLMELDSEMMRGSLVCFALIALAFGCALYLVAANCSAESFGAIRRDVRGTWADVRAALRRVAERARLPRGGWAQGFAPRAAGAREPLIVC